MVNLPNMQRFGMNLCPLALFALKTFMWSVAPTMKQIKKKHWAGISTCFTGGPPKVQTIGGYGGVRPVGC